MGIPFQTLQGRSGGRRLSYGDIKDVPGGTLVNHYYAHRPGTNRTARHGIGGHYLTDDDNDANGYQVAQALGLGRGHGQQRGHVVILHQRVVWVRSPTPTINISWW